MKSSFDWALTLVLQHEGGFSNHPLDPGGMTNLGVTQKAWEQWVGRPVTEKEMRGLTPEIVKPFYQAKYWNRVKGDELPAGIDYVVFDPAINSGPGRAAKWLQSCVGVPADGAIGPKTLAAVQAANPTLLIKDYSATRLAFLQALPTWNTFGKGWERRVIDVEQSALKMLT